MHVFIFFTLICNHVLFQPMKVSHFSIVLLPARAAGVTRGARGAARGRAGDAAPRAGHARRAAGAAHAARKGQGPLPRVRG